MRFFFFLRTCLPLTLLATILAGCTLEATVAGCTLEATVANREVTMGPVFANEIGVRSDENQAVFWVNGTSITINEVAVSWGRDHSIALPPNWQNIHLSFLSGGRIAIQVDGIAWSTVRPTA